VFSIGSGSCSQRDRDTPTRPRWRSRSKVATLSPGCRGSDAVPDELGDLLVTAHHPCAGHALLAADRGRPSSAQAATVSDELQRQGVELDGCVGANRAQTSRAAFTLAARFTSAPSPAARRRPGDAAREQSAIISAARKLRDASGRTVDYGDLTRHVTLDALSPLASAMPPRPIRRVRRGKWRRPRSRRAGGRAASACCAWPRR
jgi:hypothetical protein